MDRSRTATLIDEAYSEDVYGILRPTESTRKVFCNISSVTQTEWFEGGRNGLNPEYRVTMFAPDYAGESIIEFDGNRYSIYRTYLSSNEQIELYVERKKGDADDQTE